MDKAHQWTENQISLLEYSFKQVFKQAQDEAQATLDAYMKKFQKQDEAKRKELTAGKITKQEYKEWRKKKMMYKQQYTTTVNQMALSYADADTLAMDYLAGRLPKILGVNFDYGACEVLGEKWSFKLYDQKTVERLIATDPKMLPDPRPDKYKDLEWYRKQVNSAVTQGILQGKPIKDIAKSLDSVTNSGKAAALRNTRTAVTGAECAGREESYKMAKADGISVKHKWIATLDGKTRHSHAAQHEEIREIDEAFSNGCRYPGDPNGAPREVYNCRCTIVAHVDKYAKYDDYSKYGNGKLGDETVQEWKERHIKVLEEEKARKESKKNERNL